MPACYDDIAVFKTSSISVKIWLIMVYLVVYLGAAQTLVSCTGDSLFDGNESDKVVVDVVNRGTTRITFVSFNLVLVLQPGESQNELTGEGLNPGESMQFERNCFLATTQYMHIKWENGALRNYTIATPCGKRVTYELPQ